MSTISRTYTFTDGTTAYGSQVETEFSTIVNAWNNHDAGTSAWTKVKISSSETTPLDIISSGATTQVSIDNTATNGDPLITFKLSGTAVWSLGVDDSDADALCLTAASTMNGTNYIRVGTDIQIGVVNFAVTRTSSAATVLSTVENSDNGNTASHARQLIQVGGSSGGDAYLSFSVSGGTVFSWGIDNSDSDSLCLTAASTLNGTNIMKVTTGGGVSFTNAVTFTAEIIVADGTVGAPGIHGSDADTGIYFTSSGTAVNIGTNGSVGIFVGTSSVEIGKSTWVTTHEAGSFYPNTNNTNSCGKSGNIWTAIYATNTTIQTSHSSFKNSIRYITEPVVPRGAYYRWNEGMGQKTDRDYIGWIADPLPTEAYELKADGTPDLQLIHTNAVIGELCAGWWKHEEKIQELINQINDLKMEA